MVRGLQMTLVLVLCASAASRAAEPHPLDALTVREHWTVYDVLRGSGNLDAKARFAAVRLHPPPKAEVLAWKPGEPFRREAFAAIVKNGRTFEAVVDVANRKLASWTPMPDAQANLTETEDDAVTELVKQDEKFLSALRQRGLTDLAMLDCFGTSPGYFGRPEEREKRLSQVFCSDRHGVFNSIGRPIEGLSVLVDVAAGKVLQVIDTGVVPMPRGPVDLDEEGIGEARPAPEPITVEQPRGPSFRVNGDEVAWQRWRFHFRVEPRRGVVVSQVGYEDGDRIRSVMYEGGLSELFVPYMDPAIGWYNLTYLDAGDYGGAGLARPLEPGSECPAPPTFLFSPSPPTVLEEELTQRSPAVATETTIPGRALPAPLAWRTSSFTALTPARASSPRSSLWRRNSGRGSRGIVRHHMAVRHRQQHILAQPLGPQELLTEKEAPISSCRAGSTSSGSSSSPTLPPRLPPPRRISLPRSRASPSGGTTQPCRLPPRLVILRLLDEGPSNQEIADRVGITLGTTK